MKRFLMGVIAVSGVLLSQSAMAQQKIECNGHTFGAQKMRGDLYVMGPCVLNGTVLFGDIELLDGANLWLNGATVYGEISGDTGEGLRIFDSFVDGTINVEGIKGRGMNFILHSDVDGIDVRKSSGGWAIVDNEVQGTVALYYNYGAFVLNANNIAGHLLCAKNDPPPTGGDNAVRGKIRGQCINLGF